MHVLAVVPVDQGEEVIAAVPPGTCHPCEPLCIQTLCWKEEGRADGTWISAAFRNQGFDSLYTITMTYLSPRARFCSTKSGRREVLLPVAFGDGVA